MPAPHVRDGLRLDPETQKKLNEVFGGKRCHRCGEAATRLVGDQFVCTSHFLRKQPAGASLPRAYRCSPARQ